LGRFVVVLATLVLVLLVHGPASAVPPLEVPGQITDEAAALGTGAAAAQEAVDELAADDDVNIYTAFVPSFDGADADDWAQRTALLSELDESDILLAVAMSEETYEYGWWVNESFPLSEVDVENVISDDVAPRMEAGDWSGAVVTLSEQLGSLVNEEEEASDSQWSATTTLLVVGGVAVVLLGAHLLSRRRTPADRRP
jgi:uncharacterized membrane protein YgcG